MPMQIYRLFGHSILIYNTKKFHNKFISLYVLLNSNIRRAMEYKTVD